MGSPSGLRAVGGPPSTQPDLAAEAHSIRHPTISPISALDLGHTGPPALSLDSSVCP